MKEFLIDTEQVTLGQFLQLVGVVDTGGMSKWYLQENIVYVNGEPEQRRGKKLVDGDVVLVPGGGRFIIQAPQV